MMPTVFAAALFALLGQPASSTAAMPQLTPQRAVDTAEQRIALRSMVTCIARQRPAWATHTLRQPYLSDEQARLAAVALSGRDNCLRRPEAEITFRTSSVVANLAEQSLRGQIERVDLRRLGSVLNTLVPRNASEDFALCVAARDPVAARTLALSEHGDAGETGAAEKLSALVPHCTNVGESLSVDVQALRAMLSFVLYRALSTMSAG